MTKTAADTERELTMRNLIMYVARAFYDTRFVVVLDQLARHEVLKDDELAGRVGLNGKDLGKLTTKLVNDGLVTVYAFPNILNAYDPLNWGETMSRITSKGYYYIDHGKFCNVVKWRIAEMRKLIDNKLRNELAQQGFVCPNCSKTFQTLDILHLSRPGGLFCDQCDTELVDNLNKEDLASNEDRMQRFNAQTQRVRDGLKKTEEMVMAKVDILDWIKKHPTVAPTPEGDAPKDDGLAIAGAKPGVTQKQVYEVVLTADDTGEMERIAREKEISKRREQNALPSWHTRSTITGELTAFGLKNMALEGASLSSSFDVRTAKLLEEHEEQKDSIELYYANLEAEDRVSQAHSPMDVELNGSTSRSNGLAVPALDAAINRTYSSSSLKRKLDATDSRDEGSRSKQSRSTSYQSSPPSPTSMTTPQRSKSMESGTSSLGGGDMRMTMPPPGETSSDPMVYVNGKPLPISQVTDEHHDLMSPEEYERAKLLLAQAKYDSITQFLASRLQHLSQALTIDQLDPNAQANLHSFIDRYLSDIVKGALNYSGFFDTSQQPLTPPERVIRNAVLKLLSTATTPLDIKVLLNIPIVYGRNDGERGVVKEIFATEDYVTRLRETLMTELLPTAGAILRTPFVINQDEVSNFLTVRLKLMRWLMPILRAFPPITLASVINDKEFTLALAHCYDTVLSRVAAQKGGVKPNDSEIETWQTLWMETKLALIDTFDLVFSPSIESAKTSSNASEQIFDVLMSLLSASSPIRHPRSEKQVWFVDASLLADYEHAYKLSETLEDAARGGGDAVAEYVKESLQSLVLNFPPEETGVGGLAILLRQLPEDVSIVATQAIAVPAEQRKGKGKAKNQDEDAELALDAAVAQVTDILPEQDRSFIRKALLHHSIDRSAEKLITALLEGTLPPDLIAIRDGKTAAPRKDPVVPVQVEHRTIFDDQEMDFSKLRLGKKRVTADTLQDRTFMADMKAEILRRAQEVSSDEDERNPVVYPELTFEDELDEEGPESLVKPKFKLGSVDGEASGDEDDDEREPEKGSGTATKLPKTTDVQGILVDLYLRDPKQFDRDANTRRSKARVDLRARTGWANEQIEGWKIMLERNPKKDEILEKHRFIASRPDNRQVDSAPSSGRSTPSNQVARGAPVGRGRGHGRGGRGRGGGNPPPDASSSAGDSGKHSMNARDRAWKEKQKSRVRQGGHDKKAARGGGP
ncbi:hypothetical protein FRB99_005172 [Tulasnella sp. 403]|nr:hypothetical protein FRB99_005172 [Tulasnella sp. 403]